MFRKHCSDEQLLRRLDGELGRFERHRVLRHLENCWRCRTRLAAIESEVHSLLRTIDDHPFPPDLICAARGRFLRAAESEAIVFTDSAKHKVWWRHHPARILAGLALSLSAFAWWRDAVPRTPARRFLPPVTTRTVIAAKAALPAPPLLPVTAFSVPTPIPPRAAERLEPPVDLESVEMHTIYALHQAKACMGEGLRVFRKDSHHLELRGVVQSDARRTEISTLVAALAPGAPVRIDLRTVDDLPAQDLPATVILQPRQPGAPAAVVAPIEADLLRSYRRMFPDAPVQENEERVLALSREVLQSAGLALDHAWAIRNLATRYPVERWRALAAADAVLAREILRDHADALAGVCSKLAMQLADPFASFAGSAPARMESPDFDSWQASSVPLLARVQSLHEDAYNLFACGGKKVDDVPGNAQRLLVSLAQASEQASQMRAVAYPNEPVSLRK